MTRDYRKFGNNRARVSKQDANYRPGTKKEHCGLCSMFEPPHGCSYVLGLIDPQGMCDFFDRSKSRCPCEFCE